MNILQQMPTKPIAYLRLENSSSNICPPEVESLIHGSGLMCQCLGRTSGKTRLSDYA